MKELRNDDFRNLYIQNKCKEILGVDIDENAVEFIDEGVLNFIYKVTTPKGIFYFKQALKKAKYHKRIGPDLASMSHFRIKYEKNVIDSIQDALPKEIQLPEILFYDTENNVLIMSDVTGENGVLLQNALLRGDFNEKIASNIGRFLGITHRCTYDKNNIVRDNIEEDRKNWEIFLNMRTKGIISERTQKAVADELSRLFDDALKNHTYDILINMDCCPKNVFQRPDNSIGLIDFELASGIGDPAYDIGFALGHYFIFSVLKDIPKESVECFKGMINSYLNEIKKVKFDNLMKRVIKYAGAVMLYRVAGSSPASYIPKGKNKEFIERGSMIITNDTRKIENVVKILRGGI